jgi:hypothetical protein
VEAPAIVAWIGKTLAQAQAGTYACALYRAPAPADFKFRHLLTILPKVRRTPTGVTAYGVRAFGAFEMQEQPQFNHILFFILLIRAISVIRGLVFLPSEDR